MVLWVHTAASQRDIDNLNDLGAAADIMSLQNIVKIENVN